MRRRGDAGTGRRGDIRVAVSPLLPIASYQSLYFSPLSAVSFELERTSKTFSPPPEQLASGAIVTGTNTPVGFARHRVDRNRPQINFLLGREL